MIYFDTSYLARLYLEDHGWQKVRQFAAANAIACSLHGRAEVIAAFHRRLRENILNAVEFRQVLEQFETDCSEGAYHWLPLSLAIAARLSKAYETLPKTAFIRAADALHLACAAENGFKEIYSNDKRLLAAANHFDVKGVNVI